MPYAEAEGARLYYEETGTGLPVVFVHEFGADHREWEQQVRFFSREYRCVAYAARGYPPSDVPDDPALYGQEHAVSDIAAVMRHLRIPRAHVVGLSMGAFAALLFGIRHPEMATALVVAGVGTGSDLSALDAFRREQAERADRLAAEGWGSWRWRRGTARRACSSRRRTRAAGRSSWPTCASTRRRDRR
jgi:pimeloyl-ACP methyl ester carboxylesterase